MENIETPQVVSEESSETENTSTSAGPSIAEINGVSESKKEPEVKADAPKTQASKKKFKVKLDGQEEDVELDLSNEEEIKKHLQMSKVAQKRMAEQAELRQQIEEFLEFAKKDPRGLLRELGHNDRELAEKILAEAIEEAKKSPEQIEREKLQKELEALKAERDKEKTEREKAEFERLKSEHAQKLEQGMTEALSNGGLPKSPYTLKRMADYMLLAAQNNVDLNPSDVVPLIKKEMQSDLKDFFGASPDELIEELITSERIANIRKKSLAKAREQASVQSASSVKSTGADVKPRTEEKKEVKKIGLREWLNNS